MTQTSKSEILGTVARYLAPPDTSQDNIAPPLAPVTGHLEPAAVFASAAISGFLSPTDEPLPPFRFKITLAPEKADPFFQPTTILSFDYAIDINAESVDLEIRAIPDSVMSAPGEVLHILLTHLAVVAYIESLPEFFPKRTWPDGDPIQGLLCGAIRYAAYNAPRARGWLWQ